MKTERCRVCKKDAKIEDIWRDDEGAEYVELSCGHTCTIYRIGSTVIYCYPQKHIDFTKG